MRNDENNVKIIAIGKDDEKELLAIRMTVLESDMSKVKHQLAIT